jgi:glutamate---cysteine ligase / carboxylate-amine ligase
MESIESLVGRLKIGLSADDAHLTIRSKTADPDRAGDFSFGIEGEYFLADARTFDLVLRSPEALFDAANWKTGSQATREFLQAQIEVATNIHISLADAGEELKFLRNEVSRVARHFGMVILACGTHPTAKWSDAVTSPKPRYLQMMDDLQMVGKRDLLCGMHVHVRVPDPDRRVDVMSRMIPYLPLFLALSTSSPFLNSRRTGLKGYRLAAYDELPRTGIPDLFRSTAEFERYVRGLVMSHVISDPTYLWWMARPSSNHPTLELRATDCCTRIEDAVSLAALYRALVRHLYLNPTRNADIDAVTRAFAVENKWRAQRYGAQGTFASEHHAISVPEFLDEVIELITPDAECLGCLREVTRCREIILSGTSSDRQLEEYELAIGTESHENALRSVCDWIAKTTVKDCE